MAGGVITRAGSSAPTPVDPALKASGPSNVRRFTWSVIAGTVVGAIPIVWILFAMWVGHFNALRLVFNSDFYDGQARAIMHGHLYFSPSILRIEAFRHGGHSFTYFGIFPSLIRIPILLIAPSLFGELTAPYMFAAWLMMALFTALLMWRVRTLVRGDVALSRGEATCAGALIATITGGSMWLLLAAMPWVYDEDLAWSIALTVGALFMLIGLLERPSRRRVVGAGVLLLCANLDRLPTGWACAIGAVLVALWLGLGRRGNDLRRWAWPILGVAFVALVAGSVVNYLKFGTFFGLPLADQVFTSVNAHRRQFLAMNHNKGYGLKFLPTTLWTYFQPFGIRVQSIFPYVTLPAVPPTIIGKPFFDQTYRTASVPASMPLLFLLAIWGVLGAYGRRATEKARLLRIPLLAAAGCFGVALLWGYMAPRFEGDIMPLLILGSAVGLFYAWQWIGRRGALARTAFTVCVVILGLYCVVANFGIAVSPAPAGEWTDAQVTNFVSFQETLSNLTGRPLLDQVMRGTEPPDFAPAGKLFISGNCSALYLSTGETFQNDPQQNIEHATWVPVEQGPQVLHLFRVTYNGPGNGPSPIVPLVSYGDDTFFVHFTGVDTVRYGLEGPGFTDLGAPLTVKIGMAANVAVQADPVLHSYALVEGLHYGLDGVLPSSGPVVVHSQGPITGSSPPAITEVATLVPTQSLSLCHSLLKELSARQHG